MSNAVFPSLPGLTFPLKRTPTFSTTLMQSISGRETRVSKWSSPRYTYELVFSALRTDALYQEMQILQEFFLARQGSFDSFLYNDVDDNFVQGQVLGLGNGFNTTFQLVRAFGGPSAKFIDAVLAPNIVTNVYLNGGIQNPTSYTVSTWGNASNLPPGVVTFNGAPGVGQVVSADFTYYFPCRFDADTEDFEKFMFNIWEVKKMAFTTIK